MTRRRTAVRAAVVAAVACLALMLAALAADGGPVEVSLASSHGLRVAALGDSVTAGAACRCDPFPVVYGRRLAGRRGVRVQVDNRGVNGLDSSDLLWRLRHPRWDLSRSVSRAEVVVVTIGANDFGDHHDEVTEGRCSRANTDCVADELVSMRSNVDRSLARIKALRAGRPTTILVTGYWNVFEDGDVARGKFPTAGLAASIALTRRTNRALRDAARAGGATYVDLFAPFQRTGTGITRLLAGDGDHPSAAGHELIARVLLAAGLPRSFRP